MDVRGLVRATFVSFSRHGCRMLGGATAFYALLSAAPLLVIAVTLAGAATSEAAARKSMMTDLVRWVGPDGAQTLGTLLDQTQGASEASLVSIAVLIYAATRLFAQLQQALNHVWDVHPRSGRDLRHKAKGLLRRRALAFAMVVLVGVLLVSMVLLKTAVSAVLHNAVLQDLGATRSTHRVLWRVAETSASFGLSTVLFAALFKVLPDVRLKVRDAFLGALVTSILFSVGAVLVGTYLGHRVTGARYGAAGSLVMLLLWVHYSAQIFFLGAAFTGEYARRYGGGLEPTEDALRISVEAEGAGEGA